jgi:hypothetical protein
MAKRIPKEVPVETNLNVNDQAELDARAEEISKLPVVTEFQRRSDGLKNLRERYSADLKNDDVDFDNVEAEEISDDLNEEVEAEAEQLPQTPSKHKIKVNGKELELSYDELIERAQKIEAADEYLRTAKDIALQARTQQHQPVVEKEIDDLELVRAIQMGTEEEAAAAISKIRQSSAPPVDELFKQFDERSRAQQAYRKFESDFNDIVSDPILRNIAIQEDSRLMSLGDTRPYEERYTEIGNTIRAWKGTLNKATDANAEKINRKITAPSVPKASGRNEPVVEEEHEETRQEMIARIAAKRGKFI